MSRLAFVSAFALLAGCGGAAAPAPPPESPPSPASEAAASTAPAPAPPPAPASDAPSPVPFACAESSAEVCTPPGAFVDRLCAKPHADAALALLSGRSPFTRLYLRGRVDELAFDEEVLALRFHAPAKGGMIVGSGRGTYDVLRWDGSCAMAVEAEVFTRARPPHPRAAHVQWHRLGDEMQSALIAASDAVKRAHAKRGKECKGAMSGDVTAACEKADDALADAVVGYVRANGHLPDVRL